MIYCFKRWKCYVDCNATSKNTVAKSYIQFRAIGENVKLIFLSDDTLMISVVLSQSHLHVIAD